MSNASSSQLSLQRVEPISVDHLTESEGQVGCRNQISRASINNLNEGNIGGPIKNMPDENTVILECPIWMRHKDEFVRILPLLVRPKGLKGLLTDIHLPNMNACMTKSMNDCTAEVLISQI